MSAAQIQVSSPLRESILFVALASSTMQQFAMVILLPFLCAEHHQDMPSYEVGILLAASIAGELMANKFTEPAISRIGTKWSIQLGFVLMVVSSYGFWGVSFERNDSQFISGAFLCRVAHGLGAGLLRTVIMIARAQGKTGNRDLQAQDYMKWHL